MRNTLNSYLILIGSMICLQAHAQISIKITNNIVIYDTVKETASVNLELTNNSNERILMYGLNNIDLAFSNVNKYIDEKEDSSCSNRTLFFLFKGKKQLDEIFRSINYHEGDSTTEKKYYKFEEDKLILNPNEIKQIQIKLLNPKIMLEKRTIYTISLLYQAFKYLTYQPLREQMEKDKETYHAKVFVGTIESNKVKLKVK